MNTNTKRIVHHPLDQSATLRQPKSTSKRSAKNKSNRTSNANSEKPLLPHNVKEKCWNSNSEISNLFSANRECGSENCEEINSKKISLFYSSSEDERDECLFGTIFHSVDTQNTVTSVTSRGNDSDLPIPKNFMSAELSTAADVQVEDVSKVFKIISKSNILPNCKSSSRSLVKTYCRFNKSLQTKNVIESFCLPDTPIVQEKPFNNNPLDVDVIDAKEVTIFSVLDFEDSSILQEVGSNGMFLEMEKKEFSIDIPEIKTHAKINVNNSPKRVNSNTQGNVIEAMKNNIERVLSDSGSPLSIEGKTLSTKNVNYNVNLNSTCAMSNDKKVLPYSNKESRKNKKCLVKTSSSENFRRKLRSSFKQENLPLKDFEETRPVTKTVNKGKLEQHLLETEPKKVDNVQQDVYSTKKSVPNVSRIWSSKSRMCLSEPPKNDRKGDTKKLLRSRSQDFLLSEDIDQSKEQKNSELVVILQPILSNNPNTDHTKSSNQSCTNCQEQNSSKQVVETQIIPPCEVFNYENLHLDKLLSEWEISDSEISEVDIDKINTESRSHNKIKTGKHKPLKSDLIAARKHLEPPQIKLSSIDKPQGILNSTRDSININVKSFSTARKENSRFKYSVERKNDNGIWDIDIDTARQLEICSKVNNSNILGAQLDIESEFCNFDSNKQNSIQNLKMLSNLGQRLEVEEQKIAHEEDVYDTTNLKEVAGECKTGSFMNDLRKDFTKENALQEKIRNETDKVSESLKYLKYHEQRDINFDRYISFSNRQDSNVLPTKEFNCDSVLNKTLQIRRNSLRLKKQDVTKLEENDKPVIAQTKSSLLHKKDKMQQSIIESRDFQESKYVKIDASNSQNDNSIPQEIMEISCDKCVSTTVVAEQIYAGTEDNLENGKHFLQNCEGTNKQIETHKQLHSNIETVESLFVCDKKNGMNEDSVNTEGSANTSDKNKSHTETVIATDSANGKDTGDNKNKEHFIEQIVKNTEIVNAGCNLQTDVFKDNVRLITPTALELQIAKPSHNMSETIKEERKGEENSEQTNELKTRTAESETESKTPALKSLLKNTKYIVAQKQKVDSSNNKNNDSKGLLSEQDNSEVVPNNLKKSLVVDDELDLAQIEADVMGTSEVVKYTEDLTNQNAVTIMTRSKSRMALKLLEDSYMEVSPQTEAKKRLRSRTSMEMHAKENTVDLHEELNMDERAKNRSGASWFMWKFIKEKDITQDIKEKKERIVKYRLGTLMWAQIGLYPYWPCFITRAKDSKEFRKIVIRKSSIIYCHVTFFGDNGKTAWVNENRLMLYTGPNNLQTKFDVEKSEEKTSSHLQLYTVPERYLKKWEKAVKEVECVKSMSLREKLNFIRETLSKSNLEERNITLDESPDIGTGKRKRHSGVNKISVNNSEDRSPTRKKSKLEIKDTDSVSQIPKLNTTVEELLEEFKDSKLAIHSLSFDNENILPSRLRDRKIDEISEIDSKSNSESVKSDLYSLEAQKTLFKRNNLFKGISKDKVCQYCYQPGEVYKCKGGCNGFYHISCGAEVTDNKAVHLRRKKKRNSSPSLQDDVKPGNSFGENRSTVTDTKTENNLKTTDDQSSERASKTASEDRVQIITVTSNIYNTPPRKTFPDNFEDMSLAERIDFKMKEVMRKFETQTSYAESTVESSSEENSATKCDPVTNSPTMSKIPVIRSIEEIVKLRHGAAEQKKMASDLGALHTSPKNTARKLKFTPRQHVTADSEVKHILSLEALANGNRTSKKESTNYNTSSKKYTKNSNNHDETLEFSFSESSCSTVSQKAKIDFKNFKCGFCTSNTDPFCFVCNLPISKKGSNFRHKCSLYQCGRFYHPECLKLWPQTQWSLIQTTKHKSSNKEFDSFVCPQHFCHSCISDDPRAANSRCSGDKIVRCLRCPSTYHSTNFCVPAGTEILSATQIICSRHRNKNVTINTTWCVLCNEGGNLICCETCPTSVHPECMPVNLTDDDKFICEDCESGRLPLYDEIVWVKLGKYRWWPALILFPNEVPQNVMNAKHSTGDFVVKFFGTYDYCWVNRGRSFLFQDGDTAQTSSSKGKDDAKFLKAVEEAVVAHRAKEDFKRTQEAESLNSLKPPPYIKIKSNKPLGSVRVLDLDLSNLTPCECNPNQPNPCGPDSDCLNRLLLTECNPAVCPAGIQCKNQSFEKREYPPMAPYKTEGRGWGLKSLAPITKGQFVIEYVGELIDEAEYQRRLQKMSEQKEENYYFLTIDKDVMIDAGPKGNMARFMNHCCQPNCETQKWTVNGNTRVGLFAKVDIPADTELTFNYNLECIGKEKKVCRCGAPNCSGYIGVKVKQDVEGKKPKKVHKKKKLVEHVVLPPCFICKRRGNVVLCTNKMCNKAYHLKCLNISASLEGNKFICSWHNCNFCSKRTIRCCVKCINSFCPSHSEGNIRYDNLLGFLCSNHDMAKSTQSEQIVKVRKRGSNVVIEETAVTSTTSDDSEEETDVPLLNRLLKRKSKTTSQGNSDENSEDTDEPLLVRWSKRKLKSQAGEHSDAGSEDIPLMGQLLKRQSKTQVHENVEVEFEVASHSTPLRKLELENQQGENGVSSASSSNLIEEKFLRKNKKKNDQLKKKFKIDNLENNTASNDLSCIQYHLSER